MNEFVITAICCGVLLVGFWVIARETLFDSAAWFTSVIFVITIIAGMVVNHLFGVPTQVIAHFVAGGFLLMCVGCFISGARHF